MIRAHRVASTHLFLSVLYGNVGAIRAECFESYRSQAPFHGGHTDEKDPSRIRTLSAKRCVLFVSFAVRCGSISPTFSTFLEAVHAGLLIVKLLW
jgi:hypothetical protein